MTLSLFMLTKMYRIDRILELAVCLKFISLATGSPGWQNKNPYLFEVLQHFSIFYNCND